VTSLVVGADVIDATRWAFFKRRLLPVRIFVTCLVLNRAQVCFARLSALNKGLP
jgi:hypothetical protein